MARDPDQRYPSAEAFCRDLQGFLVERNMSVEPAQIGALMRTKFAHERDTLHRLIEAQLGDEGEATSAVLSREVSALGLDPGVSLRERPTSMVLHSVQPNAAPRKRRLRAPALAGLALVALAGAATWRLRDDAQELPPPPLERALRSAAPTSQPDVIQRAGATVRPQSADAGGAELPKARPARAQAEPLKPPRAQPERTQPQRAVPPPAIEARGAAREQNVEVRETTRPQEAPARERSLDIDLRSVPRQNRRALDLDNPFR
jgi:hypothetical protein